LPKIDPSTLSGLDSLGEHHHFNRSLATTNPPTPSPTRQAER